MSQSCVIGLDLGTGGARGVLYAIDGTPLATAHQDYPLHTPHPGWAEQDPVAVWQAVLAVLSELAQRLPPQTSVSAIGLSTIFHSLLA
ncbi:MAG TPA: FGGY family carbohydrate kinase, partial [Chloroflexota bacterium]|nr:FGGY family carbohydrate kinase [Chloroflexota bacterium]